MRLLSAVPSPVTWYDLESAPDGTFNPVTSEASPLRMSAYRTSKDPVEAADPENELDIMSCSDPDRTGLQDPEIPDSCPDELIAPSGWIPVSSDPSPSRKSACRASKDPVDVKLPENLTDVVTAVELLRNPVKEPETSELNVGSCVPKMCPIG